MVPIYDAPQVHVSRPNTSCEFCSMGCLCAIACHLDLDLSITAPCLLPQYPAATAVHYCFFSCNSIASKAHVNT
jgi:hypothetical protein